MKKEALLTTLKTLLNPKVEATEQDLAFIEETLKKPNTLVLYLRGEMKVERIKVAARDQDGAIIVDAPAVPKLVICAGQPKAVLVAFEDAGKMVVGWAKRNEDLDLVLNKKAMEFASKAKTLSPVGFLSALEEFVKTAEMVDREVAFSKQIGKAVAILRARHEEIVMGDKHAASSLVGLVPDSVFKALPKFLARVKKVTGKEAANIKYKAKA